MKMKTQDTQTYRMQWKQYSVEIPSYKWLYFLKKERSQSSNLTIYLKELEKEEQTKLNTSKRKEIMKIRVKIKQRIKIPKSLFFEKIHQTDRSLDLIFSLQLKLILLFKKIYLFLLCWAFIVAREHSCPLPCGIWVPQPGIEPVSPASGGRFLPPDHGKSLNSSHFYAYYSPETAFV